MEIKHIVAASVEDYLDPAYDPFPVCPICEKEMIIGQNICIIQTRGSKALAHLDCVINIDDYLDRRESENG